MYAIVEIAGQQFNVEEGKKIFVHRLEAKQGEEIEFDKVLLIEDEGKVTVGEPIIKDAVVLGKILDHMRGDKVIVFKKKKKKGYRVKNGHRQNFTQVEIININGKATPKKSAAKKDDTKVAEVKVDEEPVKEKITEVQKPTGKTEQATAKKVTAKKTTGKKEETSAKKTPDKKIVEKKPAAKKPTKGKE